MNNRLKSFWPWVCAVFAICVWGVTFASTRSLLYEFSSLEIQILRFGIAWLVLAAARLVGRKPRGPSSHRLGDEVLFAGMGLTGIAAYQFLENCAIYYTNASNVAILVSFGPVATAVIGRCFSRGRPLTPLFLAGSLVAVSGAALTSLNGLVTLQLRPLGDAMAFLAMLSWGIYSLFVDEANRRGIPAADAIRKAFFWALVMMAPLAAWGATESGFCALDGSFSVTLDAEENAERFSRLLNISNIAFLGVLASAACFAAWSCACRGLGVVRATVGLYATPVVGVFFAVCCLGERLAPMAIAGGVLILAGVIVADTGYRRAK